MLGALATAVMNPLEGSLFRYRTSPSLQAFESPPRHGHTRFCIYVGGLTDGLLACPYVEALGALCDSKGWALVQPLLSSSYTGYGISSLEKDVREISECLQYLIDNREVTDIAIIGHSTGCQDAVHLLASAPSSLRAYIRAVILQAPCSDREAASLEEDAKEQAELLAEAEQMVVSGRGDCLLSKMHYDFVPITASRFASLVGRGGPDDLFSSDFSDDELVERLGHLSTRGQREAHGLAKVPVPDHPGLHVLFAHSLADEYVPKTIDVALLSRRFVAAAGGSESASAVLIDGASHNLQSEEATALFLEAVGKCLNDSVGRVFTLSDDF